MPNTPAVCVIRSRRFYFPARRICFLCGNFCREAVDLDCRDVFKSYVAQALARRAGIPVAAAAVMVEKSPVGALQVGSLGFLSYKGPEYWAERIIESSG